MSANLDLVRSIYADWERGDWTHTDWAHPEIEFIVATGPAPMKGRGVRQMAAAWRDYLSAWEGFRTEVDDYREIDEERVLVLERYVARGKASGLELGQIGSSAASLFYVGEGRVRRLVLYNDRESAFADLGLTPEGDATGE
jgi:hypothetical protein